MAHLILCLRCDVYVAVAGCPICTLELCGVDPWCSVLCPCCGVRCCPACLEWHLPECRVLAARDARMFVRALCARVIATADGD